MLAACSSANGASNATGAAQTSKTAMATSSAAVDPVTAFKVGTNVNTINWWDGSRPFENMIYGTGWSMQNTNPWGGSEDVPAADLDANGWVKTAPAGYRVGRGLSVPAAGGDFICRFQGNGTLTVAGPVSNVSTGAGFAKFTVAATYPDPQPVQIYYYVDPSNYIRNIDCREASASTTALLAPEFVSAMSGFKVMRFMKWQPATEGNWPVTWATRNKPGDGDYTKNDGVPVEVMVQTANELNVDPWFTVPWNADDDYITRFATYVRDNLAPGHVAYVEVSNEVWNPSYPVFIQAKNEGAAEGLLSAETGLPVTNSPGERYVEKTEQVMKIWSTVFSGQMNRLVRVAGNQHVSPYWSDLLLKYMNLSQQIDALATAPYFGWDLTDSLTEDQLMTALPGKVSETVNFGVQEKAVAQKYGLRYITYEAGQSVVLPNNLTLEAQVQKDARMGTVYSQFLTAWQSQIGDTLTLFALTGPISKYGSWGMSEYAGQPVAQTPKMQAVLNFLGLSTTTVTSTTTTTQICPDGTQIPITSTCPTSGTTTGTTGGSTGGTGGPTKSKGKGSKNGIAIG
jgi:hypothetical protein